MAINSINNGIGSKTQNISEQQQSRNVEKGNSSAQSNSTTNNNPVDTVSLTGTASQLRALEQQIAALPVVDVQRVESIKQNISNGSYEINPPRVADKMIQMETAINRGLVR